jgi:hypothetical protein
MSIFSSVSDAKFARAAFAAAGLDFDKLAAANDTSVIKTALDAAKGAGDMKAAEETLVAAATENATLTKNLATVTASVTDLTGKLATATEALSKANAEAAASAALVAAANEATGATAKTADEMKAAVATKAASEAASILAKGGHPGLAETVLKSGDGAKKQAANSPALTGIAATQAALKARAKK